jgi:hypothetical protein
MVWSRAWPVVLLMTQDQPEEPPTCPGCGAKTAAPLTQTLEYRTEDHEKTGEPISVTIVFKCRCGTAFTQRVAWQPPKK